MLNRIPPLLLLCFLVLQIPTAIHAQTASQDDYIKNLNSIVPVSPEAAQLMKSIDFPVNLFTGSPDITIPLYTIQGQGISVPISLSYQAGGGVKIDEMATECGLSWSISNSQITREVRGAPDEGGGSGYALGLMNNPHPLSYYKNLLQSSQGTDLTFRYAANGKIDLEPDVFYFHAGNYSGKFMYDDSLQKFVCIVQQPLKITFSGNSNASAFTIVTPDGATYVFDVTEKTATRSDCAQLTINGTMSQAMITAWKLSKVINANHTDSIMLSYNIGNYYYYGGGSSNIYYPLPPLGFDNRPNTDCYSYNNVFGELYLNKIWSATDTATFIRETVARQDITSPAPAYALGKIRISSSAGDVKHIYKLEHDYFHRDVFVGAPFDQAVNNRSLKLTGLADYGSTETNTPIHWAFDYNPTALPGRLSSAQDFYGYANNNTEPTLVPQQWISLSTGVAVQMYGADRSSVPSLMQAGLLTKVTFPTGGSTELTYEPNTTRKPSPYSASSTISVQQLISQWQPANGQFTPMPADSFTKTFTVNQPQDPVINDNAPDSGVLADIYVSPSVPHTSANQTPDLAKTYFELDGPTGLLLQWGLNQVHLKNGNYTMRVRNYAAMDNQDLIGNIRNITFSISYKIRDTTGVVSYAAGGVRVKSVTTKDNMGAPPVIKEYLYNDPVTDSSNGIFVAPVVSNYYDEMASLYTTSQSSTVTVAPYLVRSGNCVLPGNNLVGAAVVYPSVIEQTRSGNTVMRTEHHFQVAIPQYANVYPFTPPIDRESMRGKPLQTTVLQDAGNGTFNTLQKQVTLYNNAPQDQNAQDFLYALPGIRCLLGGFNKSVPNGDNIIPVLSADYLTNTSRVYAVADTTYTYAPGSSTPVISWHDYTYGDLNQQPLTTRSGTSAGSITLQKTFYPADQPESSSEISSTLTSQLIAANRINEPLGSKSYRDGQLVSQQFFYSHIDGSKLLVDSVRQAVFSNPLDKEATILSYDAHANPLSILLRGNKYRRYLWYQPENRPLATCVMGQDGAFAFTSFEYPDEYSWNAGSRNTTSAFSGSYAYDLNSGSSFTISGFSSPAGLEVYAWATSGNFSANGTAAVSTGRTNGTWTLYKVSLNATASVTLSGTTRIDQLAVLPAGSSLDANVYDSQGRIIAKVNDNMQTTFFDYDSFGRMATAYDEQGNILKQNSYQYQGAQ